IVPARHLALAPFPLQLSGQPSFSPRAAPKLASRLRRPLPGPNGPIMTASADSNGGKYMISRRKFIKAAAVAAGAGVLAACAPTKSTPKDTQIVSQAPTAVPA